MSGRRQERAALRELQRRVWGPKYYEQHLGDLAREHRRRVSLITMLVGVQFVIIAVALFAFTTVASAHTAEITIGCTQVQFNYSQFPETSASATETINIDGQPGLVRIFKFDGPTASDVVKIVLTGSGTHTVDAATHWMFFGQPQGSAQDSQQLKDCNPSTSTTSTTSKTTTSTTVPESTTVPKTTTTMPAPTTTTTAPTTSSTVSPETTTSVPVGPSGSTTTIASSTTTMRPLVPATVAPPPTTTLPFTGSSTRPVSIGFAVLGLGLIALGAGARRSRL